MEITRVIESILIENIAMADNIKLLTIFRISFKFNLELKVLTKNCFKQFPYLENIFQFLVASGSSSLWSLVQHFKKPLTLACNEHLLLDLVKLFEEQPSERLRTIIEWIEEHGNEQLDELMTSRILDRNGYSRV